jgi:hypothetical protein
LADELYVLAGHASQVRSLIKVKATLTYVLGGQSFAGVHVGEFGAVLNVASTTHDVHMRSLLGVNSVCTRAPAGHIDGDSH